MITRRRTFFLGIFIFLIPFLGFPSAWKTFFICISGLALISFSIRLSVPKKSVRPRVKKEKIVSQYAPNTSPIDGVVASNGVNEIKSE